MESQGGRTKEESFQAFLWKIESLGPRFSSKIEWIKNSLMSSTTALSAAKKWEKKVLDELAGSIKKIDDLIASYKHNTSQSDPQALEREKESKLDKISTNCIEHVNERMAQFKEREEVPEENNSRVNGTQGFTPPELWLKKAVENVERRLQVTAPKMRYDDLDRP